MRYIYIFYGKIMCGITGIISKNPIQKGLIERMTDSIIHRGPDGYGYYYGENFVLGHRRLSIIDLSDAGHQPMEYIGRYVITYNGEVYNYIELRDELKKRGYEFNTNTDTEVIMAAYDFWGKECLKRFNGMWAFLIYDKRENKIFISRDRFGKKPLYYYKDKEVFIFSSEIKAILFHPRIIAKPNIGFLKEYINTGGKEYIKETSFQNIYRFEYSSFYEGTHSQIFEEFKVKRFWELKPNLNYEKFNQKKAQEYASQYYKLLEDAVKIRLRADVKIGSALSGGLDSSSIVYLVNKILKEKGKEELQETFSSVYKTEGTQHCDESVYIDMLAEKIKLHSNQIEPYEADIPSEHKKVLYAMENPPLSTCMSAWHTFKLVSKTNVKVTLDGQGADEQLAGYIFYISNYIGSLPFIEMIKEAFSCLNFPGVKRHIIKGLIIGLIRSFFGTKFTELIIKKIFHRNYYKNLNQLLADDTMSGLVTLIHYADHTSMAFSIESRMPFMDYRLVEFIASVPSCYKIHKGWTKYIARVAFDGKLPDEICWRKDKMGWPIPEDKWFRGNLNSWFIDTIEKSKFVKQLKDSVNIREELSKNVDIIELIKFLNLSVWYDVFKFNVK